jgi:hypothetical protein
MKKLESLNNEKFAALQNSEIGNLAAVVGGKGTLTNHGTDLDTVGSGGSADHLEQTCGGEDLVPK